MLALQALLEPRGLSDELLTEVLKWRLAQTDCHRGAILDGLDSRLVAKRRRWGVEGGRGRQDDNDPAGAGDRGERGDAARSRAADATFAMVAEAVSEAMPAARLLVVRFKDGERGQVCLFVCLRFVHV